MALFDKLSQSYERAKATVGLPNKVTSIPIVPTEPDKSPAMLIEMVADAEQYRSQFYFNRLGYQDGSPRAIDPIIFWAYCHLLETGDHWRVWGTRIREKEKDAWRAELIENEIGQQIRVKSTYLTANWHAFTVTPNVAHINEILQQDQKMTGWTGITVEIAKRMAKYGTTIVKSVMNFDIDPRGIATEIICDNAGVLVSPFTTGISKEKGCWYIAHRSFQPIWRINQLHAKDMTNLGVDISQIKSVSVDKRYTTDKVSTYLTAPNTYNYTRSQATEYIEFYLDDFTEVDNPFNQQEFAASISDITQGGQPPVNPSSNHQAMIENYLRYMSEKNSLAAHPSTTVEDHQMLDLINERIGKQIEMHMRYRLDGKTLQNPNGRKMVMAGGVVVQDVPNPFQFDWRHLYHWINFEAVDGQLWGRGLAEILWSTNKSLDLMKSRIADMGLFAVPETWLSVDNKPLFGGKDKYEKDPTKIKYYVGSPPSFPQSRSPMEFLQIFKMDKESAARENAVNATTYGEDPGADISGKAISILTDQNAILVTGEANTNFGSGVESIIETRLKMMKQFYTEDRLYRIEGQYVPVNVSQILTEQPVVENDEVLKDPETGQPIMRPIPDLEVSVKPGSNLPNAWEEDLSLVIKIATSLPPRSDGSMIIPDVAIYDKLAERYPEFAPGGKYRIANQATKIGMQVLQQQEAQRAQEQEQQKVVASVAKSNFRSKLKEMTQQPEPSNGNQ